jgi:hypothetical protein
VIVTVARCTTEPLESVTVPLITPWLVCPKSELAIRKSGASASNCGVLLWLLREWSSNAASNNRFRIN